ncbi:hypothetical protein EZS27_009941 [termite gut metagenome]|uniref:Uncharacterized protein n=1 Tax=termite gut metagenome TaxID=433724 RepID=A0A5J4S823_9ZZZZ
MIKPHSLIHCNNSVFGSVCIDGQRFYPLKNTSIEMQYACLCGKRKGIRFILYLPTKTTSIFEMYLTN